MNGRKLGVNSLKGVLINKFMPETAPWVEKFALKFSLCPLKQEKQSLSHLNFSQYACVSITPNKHT